MPDEVSRVAASLGVPPYALALTIGGDLQFVVTAAADEADVLSAAGLTRIGRIIEGSGCEIELPNGTVVAVPGQGHSDARAMTFADEVRSLAAEIAELIARP
jgi:thiamine monophosphate kinase